MSRHRTHGLSSRYFFRTSSALGLTFGLWMVSAFFSLAAGQSPAQSQDGILDVSRLTGTIAFVCEYDDGSNDELCLMNADGSHVRRITDNPGPDRAPTWSPDGTQLVFNSRRPPHADLPQIYRYDVVSGEISRISVGLQEDHRASWTPDGSSVVFQRGDFTSGFELFLQNLSDGTLTQLTDDPGKLNVAGAYSPDGAQLVLQSNRDETGLFPFSTYVLDTASSNVTRLAADVTASHDGPRWSPTGDRIVFSAGGNLYLVAIATGTVTTVTDDGFSDSSPAWSPDGNMLVFQSNRLGGNRTSIHVIDLDSGAVGFLGEGRTPVWSEIDFRP